MLNFKKWFGKGDENSCVVTSKEEIGKFVLKLDHIDFGILQHSNGEWSFNYTDEFKKHQDEYKPIVGFPNIDKIYRRDSLWPFFLVRIPGLKQPAVQELLKKEQIDQDNEVQLLKRFGRKTIANPYELLPA